MDTSIQSPLSQQATQGMKLCSRCYQILPVGMFSRNKAAKGGRLGFCNNCRTKPTKEQRAKWNREYRERHPDRHRAHRMILNRVYEGRLVRPDNCSKCGVTCRPEASHDDYSKPLQVEWLCRLCHGLKDGFIQP